MGNIDIQHTFFTIPEIIAIFIYFDEHIKDSNQQGKFFVAMDKLRDGTGTRIEVFETLVAASYPMSTTELYALLLPNSPFV